MSTLHLPVLHDEVISSLNIQPGGCYVDATFGRGGHTTSILKQLNENGRMICLDKDEEAIAYGRAHFSDPRIHWVHGCFSALTGVLRSLSLVGKVDGILVDLGVSSPQLDLAERGFSFMRDGPLDMRMDRSQVLSAATFVNHADETEISTVLKVYGEERFAKRIARSIVEARQEKPIETTRELAALIEAAKPRQKKGCHPATQSFQAIRIHVNQELTHLQSLLEFSTALLAPKGRLLIITFHSLEDRMVKRWFRDHAKVTLPPGVAIPEAELKAPLKWVAKRFRATEAEINHNTRARSATLRVVEKCE